MQFSVVEIRFIVTTLLNSTFTNDLKRKYIFSKYFHSYRLCSFKAVGQNQPLFPKRKPNGMSLNLQAYSTKYSKPF